MNIHNHDINRDSRTIIKYRWLQNFSWARMDELSRVAICIGDFNVSDYTN